VKKLVRQVWRTVVAASIMTAMLVATGLGWTSAVGDMPNLIGRLVTAVMLGATVYSLALLGLWRLSGRPQGAEADMLAVVMRLVRRMTGTLWSIRPRVS